MKRLTLLTILLVVVGLTAGALELKPAFTLSGSGTVEWGIDLDSTSTGFKNSAAADLSLTLLAEDGEDTHAGKDGWYGSITISNVEAWFTADEAGGVVLNGDALGIAAKIVGMGGAAVIGVYGAPDTGSNTDFVAAIEADEDAEDDFIDDETALDVDTSYGLYGTYLSYTVSEALMVGLEVVSENDWTLNAANAYAFALDVKATFAPLTISAGANMGVNYTTGNPIGFGVKVAADTAMVDGWVGFDGQYDTAFAWEVGAGATVTLMETVTAALGVVYNDPGFDNLDIKFVFTEPAAKGLVDMMDASLTVYLFDVLGLAGLEYQVIFAAGYDTGKLYPHFGVTYTDDNAAAATLTAFVHVNYDLFEAAPTTLFFEWNSGDLLTSVMGAVKVGVTVTY